MTLGQVLYRDVLSGDVLVTNYYKIEKVFYGSIYKVKSHFMIRDPSSFDVSTSPPVGDSDEYYAKHLTNKVLRYSVVEKFGYHECTLKKKEFLMMMNVYIGTLKSIVEQSGDEEREKSFLMGSTLFVQTILSNFSNYRFFVGPSNSLSKGMIIVQNCSTDLMTPEFYYFVDGLKEESFQSKHVDQSGTSPGGSSLMSMTLEHHQVTESEKSDSYGSYSSTGSIPIENNSNEML
ncbi:hypothetical protein C9374_013951 [Naegleria lovaniensis]|uniref:TCTP domain-containing protein n=1 Tax=Naegleria lovaniensis TaxID=51637 RepID=A0AA88H0F3_NAELO|nr:uncharacterized protein C9374_013951 [Naegleria lovaniensis]KAG2389391.1 hypothetical protein C9374_013951 [Naegleria lovaniensis]